jgi:hypothetical protein
VIGPRTTTLGISDILYNIIANYCFFVNVLMFYETEVVLTKQAFFIGCFLELF